MAASTAAAVRERSAESSATRRRARKAAAAAAAATAAGGQQQMAHALAEAVVALFAALLAGTARLQKELHAGERVSGKLLAGYMRAAEGGGLLPSLFLFCRYTPAAHTI